MNILILCHKMPYPASYGNIAALNMITELANQEHTVVVLTMKTYKHSFDIKDLPNNLKHNTVWHQIFVDTTIAPLKAFVNLLFSKKPYNAVRFVSKEYNHKLSEILQQNKFDIIQLEGLYVSPYIKTIRKYSQTKISFRSHNVEWKIWQRMSKNEKNVLKKIYYGLLKKRIKKMEYKALKQSDLLIPLSFEDKKNLPFDDKNCFTLPIGIPKCNFLDKINTNTNNFFYIGTLDWFPNQNGVLWFLENVWTDIKQTFPDIDFILAGRNAPQHFVDKIKKYPIIFAGEVVSANEFIDSNHIMIVPLFSGSGMRAKIIEAMARSKCVVTTTIGAEGIDVKNMENIVIANDADEMIEAMEWLIREPERVRKISEKAHHLIAKKYNNSLLIKQLCEFYKEKLN